MDLTPDQSRVSNYLHRVTPFSKYAAMSIFVLAPFVGGWVGYTYAPEKIVEIEKIIPAKISTLEEAVPLSQTQAVESRTFEIFNEGVRIYSTQDGETLQVIQLKDIAIRNIKTNFNEVYGSAEALQNELERTPAFLPDYDINSDGYADLGILVDTMPIEPGYVFYLYDPEMQRYVPSTLEGDAESAFVVYAPYIDPETRVLQGTFTITNPWRRDSYTYQFDSSSKTFTEVVQ